MSSLSWLRATGKLIGLNEQASYPHLEALMEQEASRPADEYHIAARVVPIVFSVIALMFAALTLKTHQMFFLGFTAFFVLVGAGMGLAFHAVDRRISAERKLLRKEIKNLWARYRGFKNLIGFERALAPSVGTVLDEAAAIYRRHAIPDAEHAKRRAGLGARSDDAIEAGMLQLMELAKSDDPALQEAELSRGWPIQLLKEMQALDAAMIREDGAITTQGDVRDALSRLREARMEVEELHSAKIELDG